MLSVGQMIQSAIKQDIFHSFYNSFLEPLFQCYNYWGDFLKNQITEIKFFLFKWLKISILRTHLNLKKSSIFFHFVRNCEYSMHFMIGIVSEAKVNGIIAGEIVGWFWLAVMIEDVTTLKFQNCLHFKFHISVCMAVWIFLIIPDVCPCLKKHTYIHIYICIFKYLLWIFSIIYLKYSQLNIYIKKARWSNG